MAKQEDDSAGVIACLGWGSLIWDPRTLPIRGAWAEDGPPVRAEFLRRSGDGRITLVLHESVAPVSSLWAVMDTDDPDRARIALGEREGIPARRHKDRIGLWEPGVLPPRNTITELPGWAAARGIKAVVWTKLAQNFHGNNAGHIATSEEIIAYLAGLDGDLRGKAERYIRMAPAQIDTQIRRAIEAALGWTRD